MEVTIGSTGEEKLSPPIREVAIGAPKALRPQTQKNTTTQTPQSNRVNLQAVLSMFLDQVCCTSRLFTEKPLTIRRPLPETRVAATFLALSALSVIL
jgi:hypothetical protein